MVVGVYVDDFLVLYDDRSQFDEFASTIKKSFDFTVQSPLTDMCGIEVAETEGPLSRREREVLGHLMQGRSNREIAEVVPLSVNTVKFPLKNLFDKLGVSNRQEAVTVAIRRGLI